MMSSILADDRLGQKHHPYPERDEESNTQGGEKAPRHEGRTWQEFDDKAMVVIQLCLADEVLDEFSTEETSSSLWKQLQVVSAEVVGKSVDSKATSLSSPHA